MLKEFSLPTPFSRRLFFSSCAAAGVAGPAAMLTAGCTDDGSAPIDNFETQNGRSGEMSHNPYDFGAIGDGTNDDTSALVAAYEAALEQGGGSIELTSGRFFIPGNLDLNEPGVSLVGRGAAVIGGGELRLGPATYDAGTSGVDFSGSRVHGLIFDQGDDYGTKRSLVVRNVRGLDVTRNLFRSAGKGIAVETADGNDKFHTTSMLRVSGNRFSKLTFGVYGDTDEWDQLSDWKITDNYFNFCSDTSVWIASSSDDRLGGIDGLDFAGNTIFAMNHSDSAESLFAVKRYNLRLGQTNWLRIINNNFFEAGLSAVYLDSPNNFTFIGNHVAWPGQRELADALEIHNGDPTGVIEGNTFASWTRAAVGLYDLLDSTNIEVGQNAWDWSPTPDSWTGAEALPGYRIFASNTGKGYPSVRDFRESGTFDNLRGRGQLQSRDAKTPKGGVSGASRRGMQISSTATVFDISDIADAPNFGGLMSVTVTNSTEATQIATYLLFVSSQGSVCTVIGSGGATEGTDQAHPSFTWKLSGSELQATPVGLTNDSFNFDAVGLGAISPY
jgi:hypothetical protein